MDSRRRMWVATGCVLILMVIICTYRWSRRYERAYVRLAPGTTKGEVIKQFGKPEDIEACRQVPLWDDAPVDKESAKCVEEFRYFYRTRIGAWIIGFDANGRAITKYYESSP
jgi:hypothetical protein